MPDDRLARTRRAYEADRGPTWAEIIDALPGLPPAQYRLTTDPVTGITTQERISPVFRADDFGAVTLSPSFVEHLREKD